MNVLLVGDLILDQFYYARGVSTTEVPPALTGMVESVKHSEGGAGLVKHHLLRLGCSVLTVPYWTYGAVKKRFFVDGKKVLKINQVKAPRPAEISAKKISSSSMVVVSDFGLGTVSEEVLEQILVGAKRYGAQVFVDVQLNSQQDFEKVRHLGLPVFKNVLKTWFLNGAEFSKAQEKFGIQDALDLAKWSNSNIVLKHGSAGSSFHTPYSGIKTTVTQDDILSADVDTCGAGDAFLAAYVVNSDLSPVDCLGRANTYAVKALRMGREMFDGDGETK